jgi:C-terminal processing protease CtpA/Prc
MMLKWLVLFMSAFAQIANASEITKMDRDVVLRSVISHLETEYVDMHVGRKSGAALLKMMKQGKFDKQIHGPDFARELSHALQQLTGDGHLNVEYSEKALPADQSAADSAYSAQEMERWYGAHLNFGVQKVERLEGNIGILDLRVFPPISMGGDTISAAMQVLAHTDALIIDLRNNGGGDGDSVRLVASYLFGSERKPLTGHYDRPSNQLTQDFTEVYVPGDRFGPDKPVYVLISKKTFSAAEALAYDLQALKRATVIGEPSGGGAHPFEYRKIHAHFVLWSITGRSVNPITGANWQGVGVQPHIRSAADKALETALNLIHHEKLKKN